MDRADNYIEIAVSCPMPYSEILIAELSQVECDIFEEKDEGFAAYLLQEKFQEEIIKQIFEKYQTQINISWKVKTVPKENWNQEWEKNYEPILIDEKIYIRAPFHPEIKEVLYSLTITPKMSFGTGHHPTTGTMLRALLEVDCRDKTVYDIGAGTGVLAILASKMGARTVVATDVDDWCIENCEENFTMNNIKGEVKQGPISTLQFSQKADILLANINLHILLEEMNSYQYWLNPTGYLLLSGFYLSDAQCLIDHAHQMGLEFVKQMVTDNWCVLVFRKKALN